MSVNERPPTPMVNWADTERQVMASKFDGATPEELEQYVTDSAQQSGETDTAWALRVQRLEADLLAKVAARPVYEAPTIEEQG